MAIDNNDTDKCSIYDKNYIQGKIDEFVNSKHFIRKKLKNGKLFCDICSHPFPANLPLFIKLNEAKEMLLCVACNNKKQGINPEEKYQAERANVGIMPIVKREYQKKGEPIKKEKKKKETNQVKLF